MTSSNQAPSQSRTVTLVSDAGVLYPARQGDLAALARCRYANAFVNATVFDALKDTLFRGLSFEITTFDEVLPDLFSSLRDSLEKDAGLLGELDWDEDERGKLPPTERRFFLLDTAPASEAPKPAPKSPETAASTADYLRQFLKAKNSPTKPEVKAAPAKPEPTTKELADAAMSKALEALNSSRLGGGDQAPTLPVNIAERDRLLVEKFLWLRSYLGRFCYKLTVSARARPELEGTSYRLQVERTPGSPNHIWYGKPETVSAAAHLMFNPSWRVSFEASELLDSPAICVRAQDRKGDGTWEEYTRRVFRVNTLDQDSLRDTIAFLARYVR